MDSKVGLLVSATMRIHLLHMIIAQWIYLNKCIFIDSPMFIMYRPQSRLKHLPVVPSLSLRLSLG